MLVDILLLTFPLWKWLPCASVLFGFLALFQKKKKSQHKGHKSQRLVASLCCKASGRAALLYLFNSAALWLCNLQWATLKYVSMFCCIIQKESLKKTQQRAQAQCSTAVPVTLKRKSDFVFFWWCNWRPCCLDAKVGFMDSWIHAWQTGGISKGKRTVSRWEHGSYRRKIGPNHVKIHLYGWIPTLIKQNC